MAIWSLYRLQAAPSLGSPRNGTQKRFRYQKAVEGKPPRFSFLIPSEINETELDTPPTKLHLIPGKLHSCGTRDSFQSSFGPSSISGHLATPVPRQP